MIIQHTLTTDRLILRPWGEADLEPFALMNADPRVMEHFPGVMSPEDSERSYKTFMRHFEKYGWGFWAAHLKQANEFIGLIGIANIDFTAPFTPAVEIGWRLSFEHWGKGYASEGALASLKFGFETLNLDEIVSFTAEQNIRSQAVMERIGMHRDPKDDFDHPRLSAGHRLRRHVLYRLKSTEWNAE